MSEATNLALEPDDEQSFEDDRRKRYDPDLLMYNMDDMAQILRISKSHTYALLKSEQWPHSVYGQRILFDLADIRAIKEMHRKPTPEPVPTRRRRSRLK